MRTLFAGLTTLAVGLAIGLNAPAQAQATRPDQQRDQERNAANRSGQGELKTIRGVIAAVTVEGELAIDQRTHRAASAEMTFLTIVGSERPQGRMRDDDGARGRNRDDNDAARNRDQGDRNTNDRDRQASSERRRDNVYVVSITPRTEVRRAAYRRGDRDQPNANRDNEDRNNRNQNQSNANAGRGDRGETVTLDALELGDRVEVEFRHRDENRDQAGASRKHGRHRTYFGDAVSITILAEPGQSNRDRDPSDRGRDQDRDRGQNARPQNNN